METLCFLAGIAFVYTKSLYPVLLFICALILYLRWTLILWFFIAIVWAFSHQYWVQDKGMPDFPVLPNVSLQGAVISIPISNATKTQFQFEAKLLDEKAVNAKILLACYQQCPSFKIGQIWRLNAKLKKPENLANPGSFDLVSSLKARHIQWTGYIKRGSVKITENERTILSLSGLRETMATSLSQSLADKNTLGILQALTVGVTTNISQALWGLFRRTGTTHLMVISGSHIGLVAGFCYWIIKWFWSRSSRLCLAYPAAQTASIAAVSMAFIYALLAGFAPPAQRSFLACLFLLLRNFVNYRFSVWQAWRYGLLAVLLFEPHAVLLPGFYLSFIAVAILILINQRVTGKGLRKAICIQLACLFGLMPLTLYWFSYGAINGFAANVVAIPIVGFVIVPLSLIHLFLLQSFAINSLSVPLQWSIKSLLYYLQCIDSFAMYNFDFSFPLLLTPLALMLAMFMLLFLPIKAVIPAVVILAGTSMFPVHPRLKAGDLRISILDVGQGLAVVVTTSTHILVYDTGMKFYQGSDMGKLALIPYLNTLGVGKLDKVIISHPDLDHRGGLPSLEEKYAITELLVDKPGFYHRGEPCHHAPAWQWDGVSFRFLAIDTKFRTKNNSSCVLQIENSAGKVLLPGDIEKIAEDFLVETYGDELRSTILIVPHHGSKTSSSQAFIQKINPKYAVISYGFDNRYHFPHAQTLKTLQKQKTKVYHTTECGMVTFNLSARNKTIFPSCYKMKKK